MLLVLWVPDVVATQARDLLSRLSAPERRSTSPIEHRRPELNHGWVVSPGWILTACKGSKSSYSMQRNYRNP